MIDTLWQRLASGRPRIQQRPYWEGFVGSNWLERVMTVQITDDFHAKQGRSTGRWTLESKGQQLSVYLKRHYRLPWWRGWLATVWPSKGWSPALQEWQNLEWARHQGLPVPNCVAGGEFIGPWGRLQSFLALEELIGMSPLHLAIPAAMKRFETTGFQQWKQSLIVELARLVRALHDKCRFHRDLYLCHFYIPDETTKTVQPGKIHLIDFHRLAHQPWLWQLSRIKDLAQLLYSSYVPGITNWDRMRFWRAYLGPNWRDHRWLRWCVRFKCRRYQRHNDKKRLRKPVFRNQET